MRVHAPFGAEYGLAPRWSPLEGAVIRRVGVLDLPTRMRARAILPHLRRLRPARSLDIGFGCGHWTFWLARNRWCEEVVAVDPNEDRGRDAGHIARKLGLSGLHFRSGHVPEAIGDLQEETFDLVVVIEVLQYIGPLEQCMRRLRSLLRPGGVLIAHVPAIGFRRPFDQHLLDSEPLRRLCEGAGMRAARVAPTLGPYHRRLFSAFGRVADHSRAAAAACFPFLYGLAQLRPVEHPLGDHRLLVAERLEG